MSIDLDSFPLPLYAKDREGPEHKPRAQTEFDSLSYGSPSSPGRVGRVFPSCSISATIK
uniref:Uncharacterized protein n=1 Tax=Triticum urartu TaxID=4572 RepID=A0A8R7UC37_TRIUA